MERYLFSPQLWAIVFGLPAIAGLIAGLLYRALRSADKRKEFFAVVIAFALLGIVAGFLAGFSRAPAMGTVLPAALSLVGALAIFLVGANKDVNQNLVAAAVIALSFSLLLGTLAGAVSRQEHERSATSIENLMAAADKEIKVERHWDSQQIRAVGCPRAEPRRHLSHLRETCADCGHTSESRHARLARLSHGTSIAPLWVR
jgi:uncharacterized membrane protein YeaQ/YmgE (transglycosylase-associated protein family)